MRWRRRSVGVLAAFGIAVGGGCESPLGPPLGDEPVCVALAVHRGALDESEFAVVLGEALAGVATDGGKVRVWAVTRSAASPRPVEVGRDGGRELLVRPAGDSGASREGAIDTVAAIVAASLGDEQEEGEGPGRAPADLFGTLSLMGREADAMSGCESKRGVLATGGGIHRTHDLDLLDLGVDGTVGAIDLVGAHVQAPPEGVLLEVYGPGHFAGVRPEVSARFADAVVDVWERACTQSCVLES